MNKEPKLFDPMKFNFIYDRYTEKQLRQMRMKSHAPAQMKPGRSHRFCTTMRPPILSMAAIRIAPWESLSFIIYHAEGGLSTPY